MMSNATYLCPCGAFHPTGSSCDRPRQESCACTHRHERESGHEPGHDHGQHRCAHGENDKNGDADDEDDAPGFAPLSACRTEPSHEHSPKPLSVCPQTHSAEHPQAPSHDHAPSACACRHDHAAPEPVNFAALGEVSATRAVYRILNMDCPMEEALIRKKLGSMPGVTGLEFNLMQRVLTVSHELASTAPLVDALRSIDMTPEVLDAADSAPRADIPASAIPWRKLAAAGVLAAAAELLHLALEWNARPFGLDLSALTVGGVSIMSTLPLLFSVAAILLGGLTTYRKGWIALRNLNLNINSLMAVAVTGAVAIGQYPEAAMVMVLFNLSEAIEAKSLDRARNAIKNLLALAPEKATVRAADGVWTEMDIRQVTVGSRARVRPGERVALDGVVAAGRSTVNQAPITGESLPVEKNVGDTVYAGTINESGSFEFDVTAEASGSTLARIIHAVEEAQGSRAPIQRFVDQFAKFYTPAVFLVSLLTALVPPLLMGGVWSEWIYTALVILVIGCPCALVISTPVSIVSGMAAATRHGILIKGGMFLEQGRLLRRLALDKTGTITHGKPKQTDFIPLDSASSAETGVLGASLAARSDHPVSRAIAEAAAANGVALLDVEELAALPGLGVRGQIEGRMWHLGNLRLMEELGLNSPELATRVSTLEKQGKSVVALADNERIAGLFAVADTVRETSVEALRELKKLGVETMMLTGDNQHAAAAIAAQVGVDSFRAGLLPEDKLAVVEGLLREGQRVGMVGDGINDAPALARADIGFAMAAAGTDTAIETADVALMDDDLRKIPRFIRLSRATYAILVQNIAFALSVKALFLVLTFMGQATMWMAVFADVGASLIVVANGLRAMRK